MYLALEAGDLTIFRSYQGVTNFVEDEDENASPASLDRDFFLLDEGARLEKKACDEDSVDHEYGVDDEYGQDDECSEDDEYGLGDQYSVDERNGVDGEHEDV